MTYRKMNIPKKGVALLYLMAILQAVVHGYYSPSPYDSVSADGPLGGVGEGDSPGNESGYNRTAVPTQSATMTDFRQAVFEAQEECYRRVISKPYPNDGNAYCNATWDGWGCWNYTQAGKRAFIHCPDFLEGFDSNLLAHKDCTDEGTWWRHPKTNNTWSNYTTCVNTDDLQMHTRVIHIFITGYSISIVALLISLVIFFYFRQLQCDRVTLHKNLFISYIFNGSVWIFYYTLAALNGDVLLSNPVWCQALHVITQYFVACNFFWMFCEGFYLHTIIVVAFIQGKKLLISCCVIGWCLPILTVVIYTGIRANNPDESQKCWLDESDLQWIVFGPIVLSIACNFAFLFNIVRVLITKLRAVNSPDTNQTKKAVRAILILIPLLGLQYILFPLRPEKGSDLLPAYLYSSACVTSFQGFFVALIFCFCNGEVISVLKRKWGQHRLMLGKPTRSSYSHTHVTVVDQPQAKKDYVCCLWCFPRKDKVAKIPAAVTPRPAPLLYESRPEDTESTLLPTQAQKVRFEPTPLDKTEDATKQNFKEYLENSGVKDALTEGLSQLMVALYRTPSNASTETINFLKKALCADRLQQPGDSDVETLKLECAQLESEMGKLANENAELKRRLKELEVKAEVHWNPAQEDVHEEPEEDVSDLQRLV